MPMLVGIIYDVIYEKFTFAGNVKNYAQNSLQALAE